MALVIEKPIAAFDTTQIKRGCLLYGKHISWSEGRAGFVTAATNTELIVQYHPGIGNITNHFRIPVSEVIEGQWEIRWSSDMSEVFEYGIEADREQKEEEGGESGDDTREINI